MPENKMPEDIIEFYHQWPNLRENVDNINEGDHLSSDQIAIIKLMVLTIDRIGLTDVSS